MKFGVTDLTARAVALRGWVVSERPAAETVSALLGPEIRLGELAVVAGKWTAARRTDSMQALGPLTSVLALATTSGATVTIAMGSQAWPPSEEERSPAWTVRLNAGENLLVDGRCSFWFDNGEVAAALWTTA